MSDRDQCPNCGAARQAQESACWLCGFEEQKETVPPWKPVPRAIPHNEGTFTITSMMLVITLIAICLGMGAVAPGLGILLGMLSLPAFIRTTLVVSRRQAAGRTIDSSSKVSLFLASLGTVIVAGIAAFVVFFGTCIAACFGAMALEQKGAGFGGGLFFVMLIIGGCLGMASGIFVMWSIWRRSKEE